MPLGHVADPHALTPQRLGMDPVVTVEQVVEVTLELVVGKGDVAVVVVVEHSHTPGSPCGPGSPSGPGGPCSPSAIGSSCCSLDLHASRIFTVALKVRRFATDDDAFERERVAQRECE